MKKSIRKIIPVFLALAWCVAFPASFLSVWLFNLSVGEALPVLAAPCGLTALLGLLNDYY